MVTKIVMPKLGESVVEGTIGRWLKQPGERVEKDEALVEVDTDKVNAEVPSPVSGVVQELLAAEGDIIAVGSPIALIATEAAVAGAQAPESVAPDATAGATGDGGPILSENVGEAVQTGQVGASVTRAGAGHVAGQSGPVQTGAAGPGVRPHAYSPAVRHVAAQHGIDPAQVSGTGLGGRVTRKDIELAAAQKIDPPADPQPEAKDEGDWGPVRITRPIPGLGEPAAPATGSVRSPGLRVPREAGLQPSAKELGRPAAAAPGDTRETPRAGASRENDTLGIEDYDEVVPLTTMRRTIATRMAHSKRTVPHAWTYVEVDVTNLVRWRESIKEEFRRREGVNLTYLPFVIKAAVGALREFPIMNSYWDEDRIVIKRRINIGIAVDLEDGLIVPVIHDADKMSIVGLAKAVADLAARARAGTLTLKDVQGGTFTINNTGAFGSVLSAPIINSPQAAILSMETIMRRPVVVDDGIAIRSMMNLCVSLDHRVLDGAVCGRFLRSVKKRLESFNDAMPLY